MLIFAVAVIEMLLFLLSSKRGAFFCFHLVFVLFFFIILFFVFAFKGQQYDLYKYNRYYILCCYYNTSEVEETLRYKGLRQLGLISFQ